MRVLVVPELYRPADASSCGTLADAVSWVEQWLRFDDGLHVYWLLPPRERANYDRRDVLADRDRVTLVEADPFLADHPRRSYFTENGYTEAQLTALADAVYEQGAYVDAVVDQLRTGRFVLQKWLLSHTDRWAADVRPFDLVANVHDLQVPFKYRYCEYRDAYQMWLELCGAAFADVDRDAFRKRAGEALCPSVVDATLEASVTTGSPLRFDSFEEAYADEPTWLHVAGSLWAKKHADAVLSVAEMLYRDFGVRTLLTSMEEIPASYRRLPWVDAHSEASPEVYQWALSQGDLAVCASEYETMARTPFEQAASGQVLLLRDEPWVYDCVPDDYALVADEDDLESLAEWTVRHWDQAVAENRRMVERVRDVRSPAACGERTFEDLQQRVSGKVARYDLGPADAPVGRALAEIEEKEDADSKSADEAFTLDELDERTAAFTADGRRATDRESYARTDLLYALRLLGYEDSGNPGTPTFRKTGRWT